MKSVMFIINTDQGSCQIRGIQTSQAIEKYHQKKIPYIFKNEFVKNIEDVKNSIIIFVGEPLFYCNDPSNFLKLKDNGNKLVFDVIDNFCFKHTNPLFNSKLKDYYEHIDVMIHTNSFSRSQINGLIKHPHHIIIPHQWDIRNENVELNNKVSNKAAYIGGAQGFQLDKDILTEYVDVYDVPFDINTHHSNYYMQTSFRKNNTLDYFFKPCTKLAMASSFNSILLTSSELSVKDIVGDIYEFYINNETDLINKIERIREMNPSTIQYYIDTSSRIKNFLSPKTNSNRYIDMIEGLL